MKAVLAFLVVAAVACSCSSATTSSRPSSVASPTPLPQGVVVIRHADDSEITGTIRGHGETAVLLAGRGGYPESDWLLVAAKLAADGFTTLTIASLDSEAETVAHVRLALEFLRDHGFKRIVCVGASNGASGCAYNATEPELAGLVLMTYHGSADLSKSTLPKLYVAAALDPLYAPQTEGQYGLASQPKKLVVIPATVETGPAMLGFASDGPQAVLVDFVETSLGK